MPTTWPRRLNSGPPELPGIDGNIGLDERRVVFIRQAAAFGGDDAGGYTVVKAERRTNGGYPFARFQIFRIADFDNRQVFLRLNFKRATSDWASEPTSLAVYRVCR